MPENRHRFRRMLSLLLRSQRGSALVESALTVPVVLLMLLGAVEMGDFAYRATEMSNAARAATQYAAMNGGGFADCNGTFAGGTCGSTSGMFKAARNDAPRAYTTCTNFTVSTSNSCVCSGSNSACTSSGTAYSCASGSGAPVINVTVNTSAQCSPITRIPNLFTGALTLRGFAMQEVLN
jgi:Flp pilus assembly protein TadG